MIYRRLIILYLLLLGNACVSSLWGQGKYPVIDSLRSLITESEPDQKAGLYLELIKEIRFQVNDPDSLKYYMEQAIMAADQVDDHGSKVDALRLLASQYGREKNFGKAEQYFEEAFSIAREHDVKAGLADLNYSRALYYQSTADHEGFVLHILEAIALFDELEEWNKKGQSLISLGIVYAGIKEIEMALEKLQEAKKLEAHFKPNIQAYLNLNLGKNYRRLSDQKEEDSLLNKAIAILKEGKEKSTQLSNPAWEGEFCLALKDCYSRLDPPSYRYNLTERAIKIGNRINDHFLEYQGYLGSAQMLVLEEKYRQALQLRAPMKKALDQLGNPVYKRSFNEINYEIAKGLNQHQDALIYLEQFKMLNDSILDVQRTTQFNEISEKYENEKKEREITTLTEEKERLLLENKLSQFQIKTKNLWLGIIVLLSALGIGMVYFYQRQKRSDAEKRSIEIEQQLLRAQMNPHFIFNTLNGIKRLYVEGRTDDANDYLADFSKLLRTILERSDKTEVTVEGEIEFLRLYLELEQRRMNDKLDYEITYDPETFDYDDIIPSFIIQPLVENAIWHGLKKQDTNGKIKIEVGKEKDQIIFKVMDNGVGLKGSQQSEKTHDSKGLKLIKERLGSRGELQLHDLSSSNDVFNGTLASLTIQLN